MTKSEIKVLACCLLMCLGTGFAVYHLISEKQRKIGVVDAGKLFDGYTMKKELESMAQKKLLHESKVLDSMVSCLQAGRAAGAGGDGMQRLEYDCKSMKGRLDEDYAQANKDINEQVWKRLNPLMAEFGKRQQLHVIIGANGSGNVLYNDDYSDLTTEAINYVNKKYADGN